MKPLAFPERSTTPRGLSFSSSCRMLLSSTSTSRDSTFAEVSGLSRVSHAMPSPSRFNVQLLWLMRKTLLLKNGLRRGSASQRVGIDLEIANQRPVIRETHIGHSETRDLDALAQENEIQLDSRYACGKRGQPRGVRTAQPRGAHEQIDLMRAPERVEVTRHDDGLGRLQNQIVQ